MWSDYSHLKHRAEIQVSNLRDDILEIVALASSLHDDAQKGLVLFLQSSR